MITAEVWSSIVRFVGESGKPGTAFMTQLEPNEWSLVTAKHLTNGEPEEIVTLRHPYTKQGAPIQVGLDRQLFSETLGDIAVYRLPAGTLTHLHLPIPLSGEGMVYTQDAYILGFPYNLSFPHGDGEAVLPIVKRGIICAEYADDNDQPVILIDAQANPGFSGGPLVFKRPDNNAWAFAGIVQQSLLAPAVEPTERNPTPARVPSGLSLVASATQIHRVRRA